MRTIQQIELPEEIEQQLNKISENQQDFILEAIREKIQKKDDLKKALIEGYQASYEEDMCITDGFEFADLEDWK